MHGDADPIVPIGQSTLLAKALIEAGVEVTMKTVHGAGHGGPEFRSPGNERMIAEFFARTLKAED
jgi:dipeptidyl aminopeptidase/acylaminoacyl peptidase